jgi:hypothetical protein
VQSAFDEDAFRDDGIETGWDRPVIGRHQVVRVRRGGNGPAVGSQPDADLGAFRIEQFADWLMPLPPSTQTARGLQGAVLAARRPTALTLSKLLFEAAEGFHRHVVVDYLLGDHARVRLGVL